jgi:hypothetical protein
VLNLDPIKLEVLRRRYGTRTILVAIAEPAEGNGVRAMMNAEQARQDYLTDLHRKSATLEASAALAAPSMPLWSTNTV